MNRDDIKLLFQYNDWANDRILDHAEQVSPEQLTAPNELGWGSLRGLLVHLLNAEFYWRNQLQNGLTVQDLQPDSYPDVAAIRARWRQERPKMQAYLESLSDADLLRRPSRQSRERKLPLPLWQYLSHVVNHGTQHRAECAAILTGFGRSPGDMDFIVFLGSLRPQ